MSNTGRKIYPFLKQIDSTTGQPTGLLKANDPSDADYVAPVIDYITCPIVAWRPSGESCMTARTCQEGWDLSPDGVTCVKTDQQPATPPSGSGGTPGTAIKKTDDQWNNGGAVIYKPGYGLNGDGVVEQFLLTPHLWVNGNFQWDGTGRNFVDSRMNAAGIWGSPNPPNNEWIGFSRAITVNAAKRVYIGMAADNAFRFALNGVDLVSTDTTQSGPNFNFWNIYPVDLPRAGTHYIEMYARNYGGPGGFAAEIYDCTLAQLEAVTTEAQLQNYIIFSTGNLVGEPFDLGQTAGWSCPAGWFLVETNGVYSCRKITTQDSVFKNTGMKQFASRDRLTNGVADGYSEGNDSAGGLGPYFPPVQDLINCPI